MKKIYGNIEGLKSNQLRRIEHLYRRRVPPRFLATQDLVREMAGLSHEIHRQIGVLIDRQGRVPYVIVGDDSQIVIPDTEAYRSTPGRLKGLRCVHTHLKDEPLTVDDVTDLSLLRLDLMAAVTLTGEGSPRRVHAGHILPGSTDKAPYRLLDPRRPDDLDIDCLGTIRALEAEMARIRALYDAGDGRERALLISVTTQPRRMAEDSLAELKELARSARIQVVDTILQQRKKPDPRFLMGRGKLQELVILALQKDVALLIFDQELNPSQIRSITDQTDLKVLDRTQLILDIFAQRAQTREGKLQVELAQLKYLLPRLVTKNTAMSRLTGGIGGRGPGETKLEVNRRRARDRIKRLGDELKTVRKQRRQQKSRRDKKGLPIISIIGYTNAGKSTLLNTLTQSEVAAENLLFATLDPSSRRLRFPRDIEVIITDTVGFIQDLPQDLMVAFRATLEELESADLLLHVVDISNPRFEDQIASVERILADLDLDAVPTIRVLNKMDRVDSETVAVLSRVHDGIPVSATDRSTLMPLIERMEAAVDAVSLPTEPEDSAPIEFDGNSAG
jgi:GTP-binding protein HflX